MGLKKGKAFSGRRIGELLMTARTSGLTGGETWNATAAFPFNITDIIFNNMFYFSEDAGE